MPIRPSKLINLLMALSVIGVFGSGIWLVVLGVWWAVVWLTLGMVSPFLLALLLFPGVAIEARAMAFLKNGSAVRAYLHLLLGGVVSYGVMAAWCMATLVFFVSDATAATFWPLMICSYGVATFPWVYMAYTERSGESRRYAIFTQMAYLMAVLAVAWGQAKPIELTAMFVLIMVVGAMYESLVQFKDMRKARFFAVM